MFKLTHEIKVGKYTIEGINSLKCKTDVNTITDTATLKLPITGLLKTENETNTSIEYAKTLNVGDEVIFKTGYDGDNNTVFHGFIDKIEHGSPVVIRCIDHSYLLKNQSIAKVYESANLQTILNDICKGTGVTVDADSIQITNLKLHKAGGKISKLDALKKIKEHIGITMYFYGNTLFAGLKYRRAKGEQKFKFNYNIIDDSELEFKREDDIQLLIKAINVKPDGTRQETEVGDAEGDTRTFYFHEVESTSKLKELAREKLETAKFTGYHGNFKTMAIPFAKKAMIANLLNDIHPEKSGTYFIDGVDYEYSGNGIRQTINISTNV